MNDECVDDECVDYEYKLFIEFIQRGINVSCINTAGKLEVFKKMQEYIEEYIDDCEEALEEELEEKNVNMTKY